MFTVMIKLIQLLGVGKFSRKVSHFIYSQQPHRKGKHFGFWFVNTISKHLIDHTIANVYTVFSEWIERYWIKDLEITLMHSFLETYCRIDYRVLYTRNHMITTTAQHYKTTTQHSKTQQRAYISPHTSISTSQGWRKPLRIGPARALPSGRGLA